MNPTEILIELIKPHPCLYNKRHKEYKNSLKRNILWEKISKALDQSTSETKSKWKNLKDCYTKYKKETKGQSTKSQKKKYNNWYWAPNLSFLDSTTQRRPTSNSLKPSENSNSSQFSDDLADQSFELDMPVPPKTLRARPESPHTPLSETSPMHILGTTPSTFKKMKPHEDDIDKVLNYLKNKKKLDAVDLLFNSYAESFKKLKPRTQAELKLKLAQIFLEAELKDLDSENQTIVKSSLQS